MRVKSLFLAFGAALFLSGCSLEGIVESLDDTPKCSSELTKSVLEKLVVKKFFEDNNISGYKFKYKYIYNKLYDPLTHTRECVASASIKKGDLLWNKYVFRYNIYKNEITGEYMVNLDLEYLQKQLQNKIYKVLMQDIFEKSKK